MPAINSGLSALSSTALSNMNHKGVIESPVPRRPIISRTIIIDAGSPRKITRR
jgi:hypothetical protein